MSDVVDRIVEQWDAVALGVDASPLHVVGRVQRLAALWDLALRPPFVAAGLTAGDFDVLAVLRREGMPVSPSRLAASMLVTAGATTKRVDRLVASGLVSRGAPSRDGRERLVSLTDRGRELTDGLMRAHLANESALLSGLTDDERETLAGLLRKLSLAVT